MTKININDLTLREIKEISNLINHDSKNQTMQESMPLKDIDNNLINKKVIVRTYSAGVFFGELIEKVKDEIILKNARRLYYWKTINQGLSLSEVAMFGLHDDSRVCAPTQLHWMRAIELIPCTKKAIKSIEEKNDYKA
jgi:hypothetical protein